MTIPDDDEFQRLFTSAVNQLAFWNMWDRDDAHSGAIMANQFKKIVQSIKIIDCNVAINPTGCEDFDLKQPWETITPTNPYEQPDLIPQGYIRPPWHVIPPAPFDIPFRILGYQTNDIVVTEESLPPGSWPTILPPGGLPHIRVNVEGAGEVNITLLTVPLGGDCYIQIDGDSNPLNAHVIPMSTDLTSLPIQNDITVVFEWEFKTPGKHSLDVTFLPKVVAGVPPIQYGGGIRSVQLCGFPPKNVSGGPDEDDFMIRQNPTNPCILESSVDGTTWCQWADLSKCLNTSGAGQPTGVPQPQPGGGQQCSTINFVASSLGNIPTVVSTGDTVLLQSANGAGSDNGISWECVDGSFFFSGACVGGTGQTNPGDPAPTANHMSLIYQIGTNYYPALVGVPFVVPGGISKQAIYIRANTPTLAGLSGSYQVDVCVTNNQATAWSHDIDFVTSNGGFSSISSGGADPCSWVPGTGWVYNVFAGNNAYGIERSGLLSTTYTKAVLTIVQVAPILSGGVIDFQGTNVPNNIAAGTFDYTILPGFTGTTATIFQDGIDAGASGSATLTHGHFEGTGVNPFI